MCLLWACSSLRLRSLRNYPHNRHLNCGGEEEGFLSSPIQLEKPGYEANLGARLYVVYIQWKFFQTPQDKPPLHAPTLLHSAALCNQTKVVEWLKQKAYPPNAKWRRELGHGKNVSHTQFAKSGMVDSILWTYVHYSSLLMITVRLTSRFFYMRLM